MRVTGVKSASGRDILKRQRCKPRKAIVEKKPWWLEKLPGVRTAKRVRNKETRRVVACDVMSEERAQREKVKME